MFALLRKFASPRNRRLRAFTLIELLVVIGIIGILAALLLPALSAAREATRRTQCATRIKDIGRAMHVYHDLFRGLPPGWLAGWNNQVWAGPDDNRVLGMYEALRYRSSPNQWSGLALLLPYIDQANLNPDYRLPPTHPVNFTAVGSGITLYLCPSNHNSSEPETVYKNNDPNQGILYYRGRSDYRFNMAAGLRDGVSNPNDLQQQLQYGIFDNGLHYLNSAVALGSADIPDGDTKTISMGESLIGYWPDGEHCCVRTLRYRPIGWTLPGYPDLRIYWDSKHAVINFLFADTAVHPLAKNVDTTVLEQAMTRNGREIIQDSQLF